MDATAGTAERTHDALGAAQPDDPAVDDVGHHDAIAGDDVRVVGMREIPAAGPLRPLVSVLPKHARPAREGDLRDAVRELLVGDDRAPVGSQEGIVGSGELLARRMARPGEPPYDALAGADDDDPVVVAVGDHQIAGKRTADRDRAQAEAPQRP